MEELVLDHPASQTGTAEVKEAVSHIANSVQQAKDEANVSPSSRGGASRSRPRLDMVLTVHSVGVQGATVHQLDPTASPQEKAKAILASANASVAPVDMSALPSLQPPETTAFQAAGGAGLPSDAGGKDGKDIKVTATEGIVGEDASTVKKAQVDEGVVTVPGAMPEGPVKIRESE